MQRTINYNVSLDNIVFDGKIGKNCRVSESEFSTYVAGGMIPLSPKRSRSDLGKAKPLLKIGSEINALDFLWTISALKYLPPTILVEIHLKQTLEN